MTISGFLAAFFPDENETVHLRAFKPKKALATPDNGALTFVTSRAALASDREVRALQAANKTRGIYFVVNSGGNCDDEITRFNACFAEDDTRSIAEQHRRLDSAPIQPAIRVETNKSVHAYWPTEGPCGEGEWREVQARLIHYFGGDPKIKNPSRVMRLPCFDHLHLNGNGLERKRVEVKHFEPTRRYTVAQMLEAFPASEPTVLHATQSKNTFEYHEDRHEELCKRIMRRGRRNSKDNWDARCSAHGGKGETGLVFLSASGAVKCNAVPACDYFSILAAEGLPDGHLPSRELIRRNASQLGAVNAKICSAAELLAREFPEPRWAVPGILPEGVNILAGRPKIGKSWAALGIGVAVASGGLALGVIEVEPGDVLYLALEDGHRRLRDRLRSTLAGGAAPQTFFLATQWPRLDEGGLQEIKKWLTDHRNARLVVIDTLKRIRPREHVKARIYDGDYDAMAPLGDLARAYGVSVLVVHHTRKAESEDPLDLVSGSLGLTGAADGVLVLKRSRGQADATLHASGRDFVDQEIALRWNADFPGWWMLGDAADYSRSEERQKVFELFRGQSKSLTPKAVSKILSREHSATKKLLWTMARDGDLQADRSGRYSLPRNGGNPGNPAPDGYSVTRVTAEAQELPDVRTGPAARADQG